MESTITETTSTNILSEKSLNLFDTFQSQQKFKRTKFSDF